MAGCLVLKCFTFPPLLGNLPSRRLCQLTYKAGSVVPDVACPERGPPNLFASVSTQRVRNGLTAAAEGGGEDGRWGWGGVGIE